MNNNNQHLTKNNFYVYILSHSDGTILYIGKGKDKRVNHLYGTSHNYFVNQYYFYCQFNNILFPEPNIIHCETESQALSLEHKLIYEKQPLFNRQLLDKEPFDINELFEIDKPFEYDYNCQEINYWEEK